MQEAVQYALQRMLDGRRAALLAAAGGGGHANSHLTSSSNGSGSSSSGGGGSGSGPAISHQLVKRLSRPQTVVLVAAGRTDRGVHALGQAMSFYTWDEGVSPQASIAYSSFSLAAATSAAVASAPAAGV